MAEIDLCDSRCKQTIPPVSSPPSIGRRHFGQGSIGSLVKMVSNTKGPTELYY